MAKAATTIAAAPADIRRHFTELAAAARGLPEAMAAHFDDRFLVEQLAVGDLYSVEVAADGRTFVPLVSAARKIGLDNPILELGCTVPSGLDQGRERELGDHAARVCQALGLTLGVFHVEVMHTAQGFRLIEANPRLAGGGLPDTISAAVGHDMFGTLVDIHAGRPAPALPWNAPVAASHSLLAAATAATVREDLPDAWFDPFLARAHSGWVRLAAGDRVRAMQGNFDSFGMVRAVGADGTQAEELCTAVKGDVERELGIPLMPENTRKMFR